MTFFEALPQDITDAIYDYCKDDECMNDACLRALRNELGLTSDEANRYSHDCPRCDKYVALSDKYAVLKMKVAKLEKLILEMKRDVKENFESDFNILVDELLKKWEM